MRSGGTTWSQAKGLWAMVLRVLDTGLSWGGPTGRGSVEWSLLSAPEGLHFQRGRGAGGGSVVRFLGSEKGEGW